MSRNIKRLIFYFVYLVIVWGSFRYFVRLPEIIEELWFKPVLWLLPLIWWQFSLKSRLNMFKGNKVGALLWGLLGGVIYVILLRVLVGRSFSLDVNKVGIAFVTAVVEELTFAGFMLSVLLAEKKGEEWSLFFVSLGFALIHLPINIFVLHLPIVALLGAFLLAFCVGMINGFLRLRSKSVWSPILAHFMYLIMVIG